MKKQFCLGWYIYLKSENAKCVRARDGEMSFILLTRQATNSCHSISQDDDDDDDDELQCDIVRVKICMASVLRLCQVCDP
jgi:hypothetical protein